MARDVELEGLLEKCTSDAPSPSFEAYWEQLVQGCALPSTLVPGLDSTPSLEALGKDSSVRSSPSLGSSCHSPLSTTILNFGFSSILIMERNTRALHSCNPFESFDASCGSSLLQKDASYSLSCASMLLSRTSRNQRALKGSGSLHPRALERICITDSVLESLGRHAGEASN
ncbi:hypothetical protein BT96DRAFT_1021097 [Gymnopus androsaceus JB14]|uniref:Uncharacterized protein n=1 Tax=Gymnopus androsaceus JB14 TaxID=1447944 RepID=A0A6A4HG77_9AGAR|nr:hypothetical protein BT96DRAFT_1021097 [Gymnopus androsaceus JB14]